MIKKSYVAIYAARPNEKVYKAVELVNLIAVDDARFATQYPLDDLITALRKADYLNKMNPGYKFEVRTVH